jgi:hypothetical protein
MHIRAQLPWPMVIACCLLWQSSCLYMLPIRNSGLPDESAKLIRNSGLSDESAKLGWDLQFTEPRSVSLCFEQVIEERGMSRIS